MVAIELCSCMEYYEVYTLYNYLIRVILYHYHKHLEFLCGKNIQHLSSGCFKIDILFTIVNYFDSAEDEKLFSLTVI